MRRFIAGLFVIVLLVVASSGFAQAPDAEVQIDVDNAAVWHGEDWDNQYTDPGAVLFHDEQFHMFRNGFLGWPAEVQIAYTVSDDGITWEKVGEDPVLRTDDIEYSGVAALASSALVEDDGTWVLYFYTWPRVGSSDSVGGIGRATAPAPEGPWTPDEALILEPGAEGDWDSGQYTSPSVVKHDGMYYMYFDHILQGQPTSIGMATSEDGITWTKYDDPATTDPPFANSDPVFTPAEDDAAWDREHVLQPNVTVTDDGWVMMYKSFTGAQQDQSIGFATSEDGIVWEHAEEPVFTNSDIRQRRMWFTRMLHHDGVYYLYLELQRNYQAQTDIYAGTLEIDLFAE